MGIRAPDSQEELKKKIEKEYRKGAKPKELSEKYGVKINTLKSWIKRYGWNRQEGAPEKEEGAPRKKKGAPREEKTERRRGGQPENTNALRHGGYAAIYYDSLSDQEKELIDCVPLDEVTQLQEQLKILTVRERRFLNAIQRCEQHAVENGGMAVLQAMSSETKNGKGKTMAKFAQVTRENALEQIIRLEEALTKVQKAKTKCIDSLTRYNIEWKKIELEEDRRSDEIEDISDVEDDIYG